MSTVDGSEVGTTTVAGTNLRRSASSASTKVPEHGGVSKGGTLRKRQSLKKSGSLMRRSSKRSLRAGSIKGMRDDEDNFNSVFHSPVPTSGNPTDTLANRFQGMYHLSNANDIVVNVVYTWNPKMLTISSMAQAAQRPDHLLSRNPNFIRTTIEITPQGLQCPQQYHYALNIHVGGWAR